jgi:hypothetical protein
MTKKVTCDLLHTCGGKTEATSLTVTTFSRTNSVNGHSDGGSGKASGSLDGVTAQSRVDECNRDFSSIDHCHCTIQKPRTSPEVANPRTVKIVLTFAGSYLIVFLLLVYVPRRGSTVPVTASALLAIPAAIYLSWRISKRSPPNGR